MEQSRLTLAADWSISSRPGVGAVLSRRMLRRCLTSCCCLTTGSSAGSDVTGVAASVSVVLELLALRSSGSLMLLRLLCLLPLAAASGSLRLLRLLLLLLSTLCWARLTGGSCSSSSSESVPGSVRPAYITTKKINKSLLHKYFHKFLSLAASAGLCSGLQTQNSKAERV